MNLNNVIVKYNKVKVVKISPMVEEEISDVEVEEPLEEEDMTTLTNRETTFSTI